MRLFTPKSAMSIEDVRGAVDGFLTEGETLEAGFKIVEDVLVFTDKRIIFIDKKTLAGRKIEYTSVPYRSVTHFAVETVNRIDKTAELRIWVSGKDDPLTTDLTRDPNVQVVLQTLASHVLG